MLSELAEAALQLAAHANKVTLESLGSEPDLAYPDVDERGEHETNWEAWSRQLSAKIDRVRELAEEKKQPAYFIDQQGRLWKGPIRVDNFNYSRCHGIGSNGREAWLIWVAERSDPDKSWIRLPSDPTQACVII